MKTGKIRHFGRNARSAGYHIDVGDDTYTVLGKNSELPEGASKTFDETAFQQIGAKFRTRVESTGDAPAPSPL